MDGTTASSDANNNAHMLNGLFHWRRKDVVEQEKKKSAIEYLFDDEYKTVGPTWSARVCYGVGTTYLGGLAVGGLWGCLEGLRNRQNLSTTRLRINQLLNAVTSRGPFVANNAAVLALLYNGIHGAVINAGDGGHGVGTATVSAALAGAVFRASKGVAAAGRGAAVLGTGMLIYSSMTDYIKHGRIYIQ